MVITKKLLGIVAGLVTLIFVSGLFYNAIIKTDFLKEWVPVLKW